MKKVYYSIKQLNTESLLFDTLKAHAVTDSSICAWNLLASKVTSVFGENLTNIDFLPSGKPVSDNLYISLSHSDTAVAIAFSKDAEVGVDIELIKQNYPEKVARFLGNVQSVEAFYKLWTEREAVIKAKNYNALKKGAETEFCGITKTVIVNKKAFSLSIFGENAEFIEV